MQEESKEKSKDASFESLRILSERWKNGTFSEIIDDWKWIFLRALRESGRSIPEDCSVIAIDGISVSEYIHPMLTTLCQPMTAMGEASVEILLDIIEGRGVHRHVTLPTALREGASVRQPKHRFSRGNPRENKFEKEY